ncbi:hypothetical protein BAE44_0011067 [Dichanthelium oligosanthes]|uniref:Uncharacterized protein n=1 Tax=Dichanthelium oligosanthes TaxID=888268 RepID=A0A1E5VS20_9POAL|nr:hypothetical protein BAE44_0011067 [Dichanthelium oligosanthes]
MTSVGAEAAQDCVSMLGDAIDLLGQSVEAMEGLVRKGWSGRHAARNSSRNRPRPGNTVNYMAADEGVDQHDRV